MEIPVQMDGISVAVRGPAGQCGEFSVGKGEIVRITAQARPVRIACLGGTLWVTMENDPKDYVLRRSQAVSLHGPGRIVISALPRGKMCIIAE